jgi:DNA polymerase III epsilon subunit-like protein
MREIIVDTETTDRDPTEGHRIVEIGRLSLLTVP